MNEWRARQQIVIDWKQTRSGVKNVNDFHTKWVWQGGHCRFCKSTTFEAPWRSFKFGTDWIAQHEDDDAIKKVNWITTGTDQLVQLNNQDWQQQQHENLFGGHTTLLGSGKGSGEYKIPFIEPKWLGFGNRLWLREYMYS